MKLILTADVEELGKKGDIVDVADGYARNYLLPRSLGVKASGGNLRQAEAMREARLESERRARAEADRIKEALTGTRVVIAARAGDEGKLFGSIGTADIADAVKASGVEIERNEVRLPEGAFRVVGEYEVALHLHTDVDATIKLNITAE